MDQFLRDLHAQVLAAVESAIGAGGCEKMTMKAISQRKNPIELTWS